MAIARRFTDKEIADERESMASESRAVDAVRRHAYETIRKKKQEKLRTIFQVFADGMCVFVYFIISPVLLRDRLRLTVCACA